MYKLIYNSHIPKWLKALAYILLTLSLVYLIGLTLYKILEAIRKFFHWASDKRNYWTFLVCLLILGVGILLAAQYVFDLDPIGKAIQWGLGKWSEFKNWLASLLMGVIE